MFRKGHHIGIESLRKARIRIKSRVDIRCGIASSGCLGVIVVMPGIGTGAGIADIGVHTHTAHEAEPFQRSPFEGGGTCEAVTAEFTAVDVNLSIRVLKVVVDPLVRTASEDIPPILVFGEIDMSGSVPQSLQTVGRGVVEVSLHVGIGEVHPRCKALVDTGGVETDGVAVHHVTNHSSGAVHVLVRNEEVSVVTA